MIYGTYTWTSITEVGAKGWGGGDEESPAIRHLSIHPTGDSRRSILPLKTKLESIVLPPLSPLGEGGWQEELQHVNREEPRDVLQ
jgi:hypothetical protein